MPTLQLVPQVFYDLIARVTAGLVLLATPVVLFWPEFHVLRRELLELYKVAPFVTFAGAAVAAYMLSMTLGGARLAIRMAATWCLQRLVPKDAEASRHPDTALKVDAVRANDPAAGARITKLRAETSLCETVALGWTVTCATAVGALHEFDWQNAILLVGAALLLGRWWDLSRALDRAIENHYLVLIESRDQFLVSTATQPLQKPLFSKARTVATLRPKGARSR